LVVSLILLAGCDIGKKTYFGKAVGGFCHIEDASPKPFPYLKAPYEYKIDHFLPRGISHIYDDTRYSSAGTSELVFRGCIGLTQKCATNYTSMNYGTFGQAAAACNADENCTWIEKCEDCTEEIRGNITGIITEYDDVEIRIDIEYSGCSTDDLLKYDIEYTLKGITKEGTLAECTPVSDNIGEYLVCSKEFKNSELKLARGETIRGNVIISGPDPFDQSLPIINLNEGTGIFVVANYVLHGIRWADRKTFTEGYPYFNKISDINKKIEYTMKYIDYEYKPFFHYRLIGLLDRELTSKEVYVGFEDDKDKLILFPDSDTVFGPGAGAVKLVVDDDHVFLGKLQGKYDLAHELGHAYSHLIDEYLPKVKWWKDSLLAGLGFKNPVGPDGEIIYPRCCFESGFKCMMIKIRTNGVQNEHGRVVDRSKSDYYWYNVQEFRSSHMIVEAGMSYYSTAQEILDRWIVPSDRAKEGDIINAIADVGQDQCREKMIHSQNQSY